MCWWVALVLGAVAALTIIVLCLVVLGRELGRNERDG